LAKLTACQDDCFTGPVSDKAKKLDKQFITESFCAAFATEREALGLRTLPVSLVAKGVTKAETQFALSVDSAPGAVVAEIASEGEHRCIALAAFLADMAQATHRSALVFDDPVSSLDHKYRESIANRLVSEAAKRQVIVFTHCLAFICDLVRASKDESSSLHALHVEWSAGRPGRVVDGLVWDAKTYDAQIKTLREQIGKADKIYKEAGQSEYRDAAGPVIERMRGACERIIEMHFLNGAVKRHDSKISVGYTVSISAVTREDWTSVHRIWKALSNLIEGHAAPLSAPRNIPEPDQLKAWLQELTGMVDEVSKRREADKLTKAVEPKLNQSARPTA
jgi:hypothetical protein